MEGVARNMILTETQNSFNFLRIKFNKEKRRIDLI